MRLELTRVGLLAELANHYTTRGALVVAVVIVFVVAVAVYFYFCLFLFFCGQGRARCPSCLHA